MTPNSRQCTDDWQQVVECPKCGWQVAMGVDRPGEPKVTLSSMFCSMGHERTEMEQKLAPAVPIRAKDVKP